MLGFFFDFRVESKLDWLFDDFSGPGAVRTCFPLGRRPGSRIMKLLFVFFRQPILRH